MISSKILYLVYFLFGIYLLITDMTTFGIYMVVPPLQYVLWKNAIKHKNILIIIVFTLYLISIGVGSITLYMDRTNANTIGFDAVGNFDFSFPFFFQAYSYLFVFLLFVIIFSNFFDKTSSKEYVTFFLKEELSRFSQKGKQLALTPLIITALCFMAVSTYMYANNIGIVGIKPTQLPFHLTGALIYLRRYVFTIIVLYLFAKTKNKRAAIYILIIYALMVGVTGSSKSLNIMILVPAAIICFISKFKKAGIIAVLSSLSIYVIVASARTYIFESEGSMSVSDVMSSTFFDISDSSDLIFYIIDTLCGSLFGPRAVILSHQYSGLNFSHFFSYYTFGSISEILPNMALDLFGIKLPDDKAYGVSVGYTGVIVLLSCHNYLYTVLQALIVSVLFSVQNNSLNCILLSNTRRLCKYAAMGLVLFSLLVFFAGSSMYPLYAITILVFILKKIVVKNYAQ